MNIKRLVREIFNDRYPNYDEGDGRTLSATVSPCDEADWNLLLEAIAELPPTGEKFDGRKLAAFLRKEHKAGTVFEARFGREYSEVLYLRAFVKPLPELPQSMNADERERALVPLRRQAAEEMLARAFKALGKKAQPDEATVQPDNLIRLWWD